MGKGPFWNVYTKTAPRRSNRWAATDRGWLFHQEIDGSLGNYLDYGPCGDQYLQQPDGSVHAVSSVTKVSKWFRSPAEARAWLEEQAGLETCPVNPRPW